MVALPNISSTGTVQASKICQRSDNQIGGSRLCAECEGLVDTTAIASPRTLARLLARLGKIAFAEEWQEDNTQAIGPTAACAHFRSLTKVAAS